jgi:small subunit ribosomal protein S20
MATHDSAIKAHRQAVKRRLRNRAHRSRLRTEVKRLRQAIAAQDAARASELIRSALSVLDRSVKHGILHKNSAARAKSRLTRAVARLARASV